jgi:hypothetical protein
MNKSVLDNGTQNDHDRGNAQCECGDCTKDIERGCKNPHQCIYEAMKVLSNLKPEWDPTRLPAEPTQYHDDNKSDNPNRSIFREPQKASTIANSFRVAFHAKRSTKRTYGLQKHTSLHMHRLQVHQGHPNENLEKNEDKG